MVRLALNVAVSALFAAVAANADPYRDGDVVVFFGDSITHGGRYHEFVADYYRTRFPEARIRFVNSGIGGDTAAGAFARIPEDVVEYGPTHVVFHFGMNDVGRGFYLPETTEESLRGRDVAQRKFRTSFERLSAGVRAAVPTARFTYLTPTPYDDSAIVTNAPKTGWASYNNVGCNTGLSLMAGFVLDRAEKDGAESVDWYSLLNGFMLRHQKENPYFSFVGRDRVHPAEMGHSVMAWAFLKAQGVPAVVSDVEIDAAKARLARVVNASLTGLKCDVTHVTFSLMAKSLPLPVHEKALPFVREFDVERTLNRETVKVDGLAEGRYSLKIDGVEVGRYSSGDLADGVLLGFNSLTPQYRQAQNVAKRVAELRERESVLRNHHSARWAFSSAAPVDDVAAFRVWYEALKKEGKADSYFAKFIPGYLEYWPKYKEVRERLRKEQDAVRELAKPKLHVYEVVACER